MIYGIAVNTVIVGWCLMIAFKTVVPDEVMVRVMAVTLAIHSLLALYGVVKPM